MRWFVGDVQGCARELEDLLEEIRFDPARDELWLVGDLINRGPDSLAVLRLWRDLEAQAVIGNHDLYALKFWRGLWERKESDTLDELFAAPDADELLDRLLLSPVLAHFDAEGEGPEVWAVHAGLHPGWKDLHAKARDLNEAPRDDAWLMRDDLKFATTVRCCKPGGERCKHKGGPEGCVPPCRPWDEFYEGEALVVHGHWALRGAYRTERTLGLDSSCVYGGGLTAWCQHEDRLVRVPSRSA